MSELYFKFHFVDEPSSCNFFPQIINKFMNISLKINDSSLSFIDINLLVMLAKDLE